VKRITAYLDENDYVEMRQALAARRISFSKWLRDIMQRELVYLRDDTTRERLTIGTRQATEPAYGDVYNTFMETVEG
jgi:hypothetical protein